MYHSPKISTPSHLIHLQLYHSFVSLPFFSLFLSLTAQHSLLPPISLTFPVPCTSVFLSFPTSVYEIFLKRFFKESFPLLYIIPRFTLNPVMYGWGPPWVMRWFAVQQRNVKCRSSLRTLQWLGVLKVQESEYRELARERLCQELEQGIY